MAIQNLLLSAQGMAIANNQRVKLVDLVSEFS
jgi:hypothetical protein